MSQTLMGFVGDVLVNREHPDEVFREVQPALSAARLLFANLECAYTDDASLLTGASGMCATLRNLDAYTRAGFNVMSLANNHILDVGPESMLATRSRLRSQGVATCGAGESLSDARKPAIMEVDGLRVAMLAYASIFPTGHEAGESKPGLAPIRAYNIWREPYPNYHAPGMRPMVSTETDKQDIEHLSDDIRKAREQADLVIVSFHWGDQTCPFHLTDHETRTARHAIEQGADMVVAHHHHAIRGMEWHQGKPIMYGLGHFVFDLRWDWTEAAATQFAQTEIGRYYRRIQYDAGPRQGWPLLPFPEDARMTMIAWAKAAKTGVTEIGFIPCRLQANGVVHPVRADSAEWAEFSDYFRQCNVTQGLNGVAAESQPIAGFDSFRVVPG